MDALELLREDHEQVLDMLAKLEDAPTVAQGAEYAVLHARKSLVTEVVVAESQHEAVEEQYFWPLVRSKVPNGEELAAKAVDQERAAKYLLSALEETGPDQPDIDDMIARLVHDGRAHIEYEQNEVWPRLRDAVDSDELDELGSKMATAKKHAPTRPHPETPSSPVVQHTVGRVAALADRIRDTLGHRGK